jgi:hypothetical protein
MLRNFDPRLWTGIPVVATGVKEVADEKLVRLQLLAQTWHRVIAAGRTAACGVKFLSLRVLPLPAGIAVDLKPSGGMPVESLRCSDVGLRSSILCVSGDHVRLATLR